MTLPDQLPARQVLTAASSASPSSSVQCPESRCSSGAQHQVAAPMALHVAISKRPCGSLCDVQDPPQLSCC
eukprot:7399672-Alexandrium_andersonii.AAC.1